jgi:crotonobetaine/carnitine-CoA ligase
MPNFETGAWPFAGHDIRTLLAWRRSESADRPLLIWEPWSGEGEVWTYAAFIGWIERFAAGLHARGVGPGDRVLVHMENCPEAIVAWLGCAVAGAVAVTTNARSSPEELRYYAENARAVAGLTQPKFLGMIAESCRDLRWIAATATDSGEAPASKPAKNDLFDAIRGDPADLPRRARDPAAPFSVQYTSGTTSRPKGVLWTHANALWGARVSAAHEGLSRADAHLTSMPLYHTNAQIYSVLASVWAGATIVLQPRFSASRFWPTAVKRQCTWTSIVPFCVKALESTPRPERHSFRLWGNAYCSPPQDVDFKVRTIGWWGMTETVTHGIVGLIDGPNASFSMGRAAPEYELRVLNERGEPCQPGEVGDLSIRGVRGLSLFAEYLDDHAATAAAFDRSGFFLTGDRVWTNEDGFFFFADRAKDMLKVGGENVSAAEIERVILATPGVRDAVVVGKPDAMLDEVPVAFVIASDGQDPGLIDRITAACRVALASFKLPREVRLVGELPRATLEKVSKAKLRQLLREEETSARSAEQSLGGEIAQASLSLGSNE